MSALQSHIWGECIPVDRVWAQVVGLAPDRIARQHLMVFQAYIDDSYTAGGEFVLAGHIATAENWANFSRDWAEILPYGKTRSNRGDFHFKMSEMAVSPERLERVAAFYRIIEKYVAVSVFCRFNVADLKRAKQRIVVPGYRPGLRGYFDYPFMFAFKGLMDTFHQEWKNGPLMEVIPSGHKVDFYFDDQSEKKMVLEGWDEYLANRPDGMGVLFGETPRFEKDEEFLPLQAADFWAWWCRECYEAGNPYGIGSNNFFGKWEAYRDWFKIGVEFDEDLIVKTIISGIRGTNPRIRTIYDVKFSGFEALSKWRR